MCDNCSKLDIKMVNETIESCVVPIDDKCFIIFSYDTDQRCITTYHVLEKIRKWLVSSE